MKSPFTNVLTWVLRGRKWPKKKKKKEEGNISGYLFLCPCDTTDRNLGGTCAYLVPLRVHQVMSPQALAFGQGSLQAGKAVWSLDLQEYPKQVGTFGDTGPWYPQQGPGGDSKGSSRCGPEQAEQGVLDLRAHWGDMRDVPGAWGAWKLLQRLKLGWQHPSWTSHTAEGAVGVGSGWWAQGHTVCKKR